MWELNVPPLAIGIETVIIREAFTLGEISSFTSKHTCGMND